MANVGVIGGSGVYSLDEIELVREHEVVTPFGKPSDNIIEGKLKGHTFFFFFDPTKLHTPC